MKKSLLILIGLFIYVGIYAQNRNNVKFEKKDGKFHLKIEQEADGVKTTIDKTYNSVEEMKNDPDLEGIDLHFFEGKNLHEMSFFGDDISGTEQKMNVVIKLDGDAEFDFDKDFGHNFTFKTNGDDFNDVNNIKVWIDDDGEKHISRNGAEIDLGTNSWTDEEGNNYLIEKVDGKILINSDGELDEFINADGEIVELHLDHDAIKDGEHKVMFYSSTEGDSAGDKIVSVKVIERISIHLVDVEEGEFIKIAETKAPLLEMDDLSYYPNPNSGTFTLQFRAAKSPTEVKITSLDGKTVYEENIQGFEGNYQNVIDLSGQEKGIYLLQIIQGSRASNKKIIIE